MSYGFTVWEKVEFEQLQDDTFKVGENIYNTNFNDDPDYWEDEILGEVSYHRLYDENENNTDYVVVYPRIKQEDYQPEEWCEEYDTDNCFIVKIG